jgi:glycosyltransferase involved in cell wall biosynthesis
MQSSFINPRDISIIIPVKNNQLGIDQFLKVFFSTHEKTELFPKEIIIIDNNSNPPIFIKHDYSKADLKLKIYLCKENGPSAARNMGVKNSTGSWILFSDSDCFPTESFISGYIIKSNGSIGYAGNIKSLGKDIFSLFYDKYKILVPSCPDNSNNPKYTTTANTLIWKKGIEEIGGFNENFNIAGGEDVELGMRLRKIGKLDYAHESLVLHDFKASLKDFVIRFFRYGRGEKIIEKVCHVNRKPKMNTLKGSNLINSLLLILMFLIERTGYYYEEVKQKNISLN